MTSDDGNAHMDPLLELALARRCRDAAAEAAAMDNLGQVDEDAMAIIGGLCDAIDARTGVSSSAFLRQLLLVPAG